MRKEGYDVAQICINGHVVNSSALSSPQYNKNFCKECGGATTMECSSCSTKIKGHYHFPNIVSFGGIGYQAPKFCDHCGDQFPWTSAKLDVTKELIELADELTAGEKEDLRLNIEDLIKDGPKVQVAQLKVKRLLAKVERGVSIGIHEALTKIISKTVEDYIWK
jgi:hypothetical protein